MAVTIKEPDPTERNWVIAIHGTLYSQEFGFDNSFESDIAKKVAGVLSNQDGSKKLFYAYVRTEPVGSIAVSRISEDTGFINFFLVLPEFRSKGIGTSLFSHVIEYSKNCSLTTLRLETYSCLKAARNLYKDFGFTMVESHQDCHKYGQRFDQEFWERRL